MDNKKYLDKVVGSLVRGTKIDYDKEIISFSHHRLISYILHPSPHPHIGPTLVNPFTTSFFYGLSNYCKNTFGLTKEEMREYVWKEYRSIIKDKIEDGE